MTGLNQRRGFALVAVLCALLFFVNVSEDESEATEAFRSGQYVESELDSVLAARQGDELTHEQLELGSLVVAGLSAVTAVLLKH